MSINDRNRVRVRNTDVVRLNPDNFAIILVRLIDGKVAAPSAALVHEPEVGEGSKEGAMDMAERRSAQVGKEVVEEWEEEDGVGRQ